MSAPLGSDPLRDRKTLADLVAGELRQRIVSGSLPMGAELNQLALTEELGVSRAVVREAFRQLQAAGMIRLSPYHHAVVTPLDEGDLSDLLAVRTAIESAAVARASTRGDEAGLERLAAHLAALEVEVDPEAWLYQDHAFHLGICEAAGSPSLRHLLDAVRLPVDRFMQLVAGVGPRMAAANDEHRALLDALRQGDARLAQRLVRQHIEATRRLLKERLRTIPEGRGDVR